MVIPGLDEGIMQLSIGARARMVIPADLAYGKKGFPGLVPPNTPVEFDIELIEVV
jgi:FKBP-type peptidyl-prolyl cis-trans isomerase